MPMNRLQTGIRRNRSCKLKMKQLSGVTAMDFHSFSVNSTSEVFAYQRKKPFKSITITPILSPLDSLSFYITLGNKKEVF